MALVLVKFKLPQLQALSSKEALVHPTVRAHIQDVTFLEKVVPRAIRQDSGGGYHAKPSWVPEFRFTYVVKGRSYEKVWGPDVNEITPDAFEVLALFGNRKEPSAQFQAYWREHVGQERDLILVNGDPASAEILLGYDSPAVQIDRLKFSVKALMVLVLFIGVTLALRYYAYLHSWELYSLEELDGVEVRYQNGVSPVLRFMWSEDRPTRPVALEVDEGPQDVTVKIYKQTALVGWGWFHRSGESGNGRMMQMQYDKVNRRYTALLSYSPIPNRRFLLQTPRGTVPIPIQN